MSEAIKPTRGEWHAGGSNRCTVYDEFGQRIADSFEGVMVVQRTAAECRANAAFIAEAGTVHHETGLTPRQLVEQRDALAAALAGLDEAYCRAGTPLSRDERTEDRKRLIAAREALALVKGAKP